MSDYDITEAMFRYGGSFIQQLGRLWRVADDLNQQRIRAAFTKEFALYEELARRAAQGPLQP